LNLLASSIRIWILNSLIWFLWLMVALISRIPTAPGRAALGRGATPAARIRWAELHWQGLLSNSHNLLINSYFRRSVHAYSVVGSSQISIHSINMCKLASCTRHVLFLFTCVHNLLLCNRRKSRKNFASSNSHHSRLMRAKMQPRLVIATEPKNVEINMGLIQAVIYFRK
jgi:hypothetical protein